MSILTATAQKTNFLISYMTSPVRIYFEEIFWQICVAWYCIPCIERQLVSGILQVTWWVKTQYRSGDTGIFWRHGSKSMVRFSSMMSSLMRVWWLMINGSIKKPTERQLQHICSSHKMCEASAIKTLAFVTILLWRWYVSDDFNLNW